MNSVFNYFLGPPSVQKTCDDAFFKDDKRALLTLIDSHAGIPLQVGEMIANYVVGDETRFRFEVQDITNIFFQSVMPIGRGLLVSAALAIAVAELLSTSVESASGTFMPVIRSTVGAMVLADGVKIVLKPSGIVIDGHRAMVTAGCAALFTSVPLPFRIVVAAVIVGSVARGVNAIIDAQKILRPSVGQLYRHNGQTWLYHLSWRCVDFDY